MLDNYNMACGGGRHENQMDGYSENIESKDIVSFSYVGSEFNVSAKKENELVQIFATGGGKYNQRDGSYFIIKYDTNDESIFKQLQEVIDENHETIGNGHTLFMDGLPAGLGDLLNVTYASGEQIYKSSNQAPTVRPETTNSFYEIFHSFVQKDGYDFNSAGSNVKLFDDADEEYLQGTWKGNCRGDSMEVTFQGNRVTIIKNGEVVDDNEEYTICQGSVKRNVLKEGAQGNSPYDYENFNYATDFTKKNWFTINGYFYENGSSFSCELMNFDKEKPADEE